ncbi:MAG: DUF2802 domain-containing protein [Gammaproteobacteria bacterium]
MRLLDNLTIPDPGSVLGDAAALFNSFSLPAATPASVAIGLLAVPVVIALLWLGRRLTRRHPASSQIHVVDALDELSQRLRNTELMLADTTSEAAQLRQRVDQLSVRQDSQVAGNSRSTLRQAIALSKHGATTRQLVETCSLSQGEAHLIQTLYGRPPGPPQAEELH